MKTKLARSGMRLVIFGWKQIHRSTGLMTTGLYAHLPHPQYTGLFLIIVGWIFHWATLLTRMMAPLLLLSYYLLARWEEAGMIRAFGAAYEGYRRQTGMFLPLIRQNASR